MPPQTNNITSLEHIASGKVREIYRIDGERLLFVASDRLSAFDVVMPTLIPGKGRILTRFAEFWFEHSRHIIPNHLISTDISDLPLTEEEKIWLQGRSMIVRNLKVIPVEAIVRGYLVGSGWKEYQQSKSVCGIALPAGLQLADKLPDIHGLNTTKRYFHGCRCHTFGVSCVVANGVSGLEIKAFERFFEKGDYSDCDKLHSEFIQEELPQRISRYEKTALD